MKTNHTRKTKAGYISFLLVISTGAVLLALMVAAYRRAITSHAVESSIQLSVDYSEKEEAILRSIVAITPNKAIRAMQTGSANDAGAVSWENIFNQAVTNANARTSIPAELTAELGIANLRGANTGDSALTVTRRTFSPVALPGLGFVTAGTNVDLGAGYPPALTLVGDAAVTADNRYPSINSAKQYGALANGRVGLPVADYPSFNLLTYPRINFGYTQPGQPFVAKRNWWAFSVNAGGNEQNNVSLTRRKRDFVLSIYEVPSQLAISSNAFMAIGSDTAGLWSNVTVDGGLFVGSADVVANDTVAIGSLASRRGTALPANATVGGRRFEANPFRPGGNLDTHALTQGSFFPVSLASESGKAVFVPLNRGGQFYDRFALTPETNVLSPTTWDDYTIGARQCVMKLDVTLVTDVAERAIQTVRFTYLDTNLDVATQEIPLENGNAVATLPEGYMNVVYPEGTTIVIPPDEPSDVAYGGPGGYYFMRDVTGPVTFSNASWRDPNPGGPKTGYRYLVRLPFKASILPSTADDPVPKHCISIFPERLPLFLGMIGGAPVENNNSLVVNMDYTPTSLDSDAYIPTRPTTPVQNGLILTECSNLSAFIRGFSLVTNLPMYMGQDFNVVPIPAPNGYIPVATAANPGGLYWPPCSLFSPERKWGVDVDPFGVTIGGQLGSLAQAERERSTDPNLPLIRPLEARTGGANVILAPAAVTANLSQIRHPCEVPPICMMNWLVLLEERKSEYYEPN